MTNEQLANLALARVDSQPPRTPGRRGGELTAISAVLAFMCRRCWRTWFPGQQPDLYQNGNRVCIVHPDDAPELTLSGFTVTPATVPGADLEGLFCPHTAGRLARPPTRTWNTRPRRSCRTRKHAPKGTIP